MNDDKNSLESKINSERNRMLEIRPPSLQINNNPNEMDPLDYDIDPQVLYSTEIGEKMKKWVNSEQKDMIHSVWIDPTIIS